MAGLETASFPAQALPRIDPARPMALRLFTWVAKAGAAAGLNLWRHTVHVAFSKFLDETSISVNTMSHPKDGVPILSTRGPRRGVLIKAPRQLMQVCLALFRWDRSRRDAQACFVDFLVRPGFRTWHLPRGRCQYLATVRRDSEARLPQAQNLLRTLQVTSTTESLTHSHGKHPGVASVCFLANWLGGGSTSQRTLCI